MKQQLRLHLATVSAAMVLAAVAVPLEAQEPPPPERVRAFVWKSVDRGYLGLRILDMTPELRVHFGAPEDEGVLVSRVEEGTPAAEAGILVGDILTSVDGESIESPARLSHAVGGREAGDVVTIDLWRDGASRSVSVTVDERERNVMDFGRMPRIAPFEHEVIVEAPGFRFDGEAMKALEGARRELLERFEGEDFRRKLNRLQELDLSGVEERMRRVEDRLRELERELAREAENRRRPQ